MQYGYAGVMAGKSLNFFQSIEKLKGRENFHDWCESMEAYLRLEKLWTVVQAPPSGNLETDAEKVQEVRSKILLSCEPGARIHFSKDDSVPTIWQKLKTAYEDKGFIREVTLLRDLCQTNLEECGSTEDYLHKIYLLVDKLRNINMNIPDRMLAGLLLAGLPERYSSLVMAFSGSAVNITSDLVKSKIIEEVKYDSSSFDSSSEIAQGLYTRASQSAKFSRARAERSNHHSYYVPEINECKEDDEEEDSNIYTCKF